MNFKSVSYVSIIFVYIFPGIWSSRILKIFEFDFKVENFNIKSNNLLF